MRRIHELKSFDLTESSRTVIMPKLKVVQNECKQPNDR